jgi:hypothetical protein
MDSSPAGRGFVQAPPAAASLGRPVVKKLLFVTAAAFCVTSAAHASIIPVLDSVVPDAGVFDFNYHITLSSDQGLTDGSKVVIYDFLGYVPGSIFNPTSPLITPSVELFSSTNTAAGGVQVNAQFTDDPNITNLVFTYHGPDFRTTAAPPGSPYEDIILTGFGAKSIYGGVTSDGFSARAIKNSGLATVGTVAFNNGAVGVPTLAAVPEPTSWALLILG